MKLDNMVATNGGEGIPPNANPNCNPAAPKTLIFHIPDQNFNLFLPQVKAFLPCRLHNLHLHPWPINSNSWTHPSLQVYFCHCLEWALHKFSNLPPSLLTFPRRQSSLSHAVSLWNLILCCQSSTHASIKVISRLNCLQEFREQTSHCSYTLSQEKPTLTPSTGGCLTAFVLKLHSPFDLFPP